MEEQMMTTRKKYVSPCMDVVTLRTDFTLLTTSGIDVFNVETDADDIMFAPDMLLGDDMLLP
jgi:hypothetical protein